MVTVKSNSGLQIGHWLERGIVFRGRRGVARSAYFTNEKGAMIWSKDLEIDILDRLAEIQQLCPDLNRPGLEVHEKYDLSKYFRRTHTWRQSITELRMGISIEVFN